MPYVLCSNSNRAFNFFGLNAIELQTQYFWDNTCCISIARWWFKLQVLVFILKTKQKRVPCSICDAARIVGVSSFLDGNGCSLVENYFTWNAYASYQWWHTLLHFISHTRNIARRQPWPRLLLTDPYTLRLMGYGLNHN